MCLVAAVLQEKILVVKKSINDFICHHGEGAGGVKIQLARRKGTPPGSEHNQQCNSPEHIQNVGVAHHPGSSCKSRSDVKARRLFVFGEFIKIVSQQGKEGSGKVVAQQAAAFEKANVGGQQQHRDQPDSPVEASPAGEINHDECGRGGEEIKDASLKKSKADELMESYHQQKVDRRARVPCVLNVSAEITHHRNRHLVSIEHLISDLHHVCFIAFRDRHRGQAL